ncbi:hypothetical protein [Glaciihabitans sp. UYNi722]|uniref:hypothetical protein n=1 Tax=Glaciihabitans sp. UYNi722 TaxID=3156344 RepID=UPI00339240F4
MITTMLPQQRGTLARSLPTSQRERFRRGVLGETTIVLPGSHEGENILGDEMEQLALDRGAHFCGFVGRRSRRAYSWLPVRDVERKFSLKSIFLDLKSSDLYICGSLARANGVLVDVRAYGPPDHQIHRERFEW